MLVCQSVGWSISAFFTSFGVLELFWAYCSCPNAPVTFSSTAPAHPHATGVAVYLASFFPVLLRFGWLLELDFQPILHQFYTDFTSILHPFYAYSIHFYSNLFHSCFHIHIYYTCTTFFLSYCRSFPATSGHFQPLPVFSGHFRLRKWHNMHGKRFPFKIHIL